MLSTIKQLVDTGDLNTLKIILDSQTEDVYNQALIYAIDNQQLDIAHYLLNNGSDIHTEDDYPLRTSSWYGPLKLVELCIKHGANIHAVNDQALVFAIENQQVKIVELLLNHKANISLNALEVALEVRNYEILRLLQKYIV